MHSCWLTLGDDTRQFFDPLIRFVSLVHLSLTSPLEPLKRSPFFDWATYMPTCFMLDNRVDCWRYFWRYKVIVMILYLLFGAPFSLHLHIHIQIHRREEMKFKQKGGCHHITIDTHCWRNIGGGEIFEKIRWSWKVKSEMRSWMTYEGHIYSFSLYIWFFAHSQDFTCFDP